MKQRIALIFVFTYLFIHSFSAFFLSLPSGLQQPLQAKTRILPPLSPYFLALFFLFSNLLFHFPLFCECLGISTHFLLEDGFLKAAVGRLQWSDWSQDENQVCVGQSELSRLQNISHFKISALIWVVLQWHSKSYVGYTALLGQLCCSRGSKLTEHYRAL